MGLVEKAAELFGLDHEQPPPGSSVRGSERFSNTLDWRILKWVGVVTLGVIVGGLVGKQMDPTVLGVGTVVGLAIGFFGGIALANRIIDVQ